MFLVICNFLLSTLVEVESLFRDVGLFHRGVVGPLELVCLSFGSVVMFLVSALLYSVSFSNSFSLEVAFLYVMLIEIFVLKCLF